MSKEIEGRKDETVEAAFKSIAEILETARSATYRAVNAVMVKAYWEIGRVIVEEELNGKSRAEYGSGLIRQLAERLRPEFGRGLSERNLWHMRNFYMNFQKVNALRSELTWPHYRLPVCSAGDLLRRPVYAAGIDPTGGACATTRLARRLAGRPLHRFSRLLEPLRAYRLQGCARRPRPRGHRFHQRLA